MTGEAGRRHCNAGRQRAGASILEFAVSLPLLLVFLFGTIEFGIYFMNYQVVHEAARANVRDLALFRSSCSSAALEADATTSIIDIAGNSGVELTAGNISMDGTCDDDERFVTIDVSVDYNFAVLSSLVGSVPEFITMNVGSIAANQNFQE